MPFGFHPAYLIILLVVVLIVFGPGKLPDLGGAVGRGLREFHKASNEVTDGIAQAMEGRQGEQTATRPATMASAPAPDPSAPPSPTTAATEKK
jgi:sec-independent protein translocase protein TatA